ncbi:MAG: hypothetical protein IMZ64_07360 [Bacteroidetes bacterium]|nr:hypothetical protein [Bacteroidota bacterium]
MLTEELKYYNENLAEWLKSQSGKFVVIKDQELIGFYNSFDEALSVGARKFGLQSFLVRCIVQSQEEINIPALTLGILNANSTHSVHI